MKQNVRALAAEIILDVIDHHRSLPVVIAQRIPEDYDQRPLLYELCYGVLRWSYLLNALLDLLLLKPLPKKNRVIGCLLMVGLHQLLNMKIPEYAAVSETVQAVNALGESWAKGLVNKVLRRFIEESPKLLEKASKIETAHYVHPQWMIDKIRHAWPNHWQAILNANNLRAPLTLRVNKLKNNREQYLKLLEENAIQATPLSEFPTALNLEQPVSIEKIPGFSDGLVSVQDIAGQFASTLLNLKPDSRVLDACAAPGSKSAEILESQPELARLVAVEKDPERLPMIKQNIERLQLKREKLSLVLADAANTQQWWHGDLFDRILVDAPCSGSGVIRRHPDIKLLRHSTDIPNHHQVQVHLLNHMWPLLEKKGLLLYSTCSIFPEENEKTISAFLQKHPDAKVQTIQLPIGEKQTHGWQLLPTVGGCDGFYYCLLQKS